MSKIALQGHVSGTGTIYFSAPNTNTDRTYTLPDATGTVMVSGNMPAFSAYNSSVQSIANNTFTKVQFQTENFDTNNNFDNTTNYRFTPNVAGYYHISEQIALNSLTANSFSAIYKNGSAIAYSPVAVGWSGIANTLSSVAADVYMNGTTDYVEVYVYQASGGALNTVNAANASMFSGFLTRAA